MSLVLAVKYQLTGARLLATLLIILMIQTPRNSYAQTDSSNTTGIILASILPAGIVGGALYQNYATWWKGAQHASFNFSNDPPYAYHADKLGHAFFTTISADIIRRGYIIAGVDSKTATWIGAGSALLAQTLVEVEDGFHTGTDYFGFSPGDEAGDILGAALPVMQEYVPYLRNFKYKWSIWPSEVYNAGVYHTIIDDNESQFFWISVNLRSITENNFFPSFLNPALGYGVENLPAAAFIPSRIGKQPASLWFIALDLNFEGLPIHGQVWDVIAEVLDHFHVPLPALQFAPKVKFLLR